MPYLIEQTELSKKIKRSGVVSYLAGGASMATGALLETAVIVNNPTLERLAIALVPAILGFLVLVRGALKIRHALEMEKTPFPISNT